MAFTKVAQDRPRVLIVGGGYVGFTVAKKIQKAIKETVALSPSSSRTPT